MPFFSKFRKPRIKNREQPRAQSEAIFHKKEAGRYLADIIFGANDGIITTFAVVAGAWGAALGSKVIVILGLANLLGDGLSMGLGNYLGRKSQVEHERSERQREEWEVEHLPEKERGEIRDILRAKGFKGKDLERAVEIISSDKKVWVDFMMTEELGICESGAVRPVKHGLAIFLAFAVFGFFALIPFFLKLPYYSPFIWSTVLSIITLFAVGAWRARIYVTSWLKAGLEMLLIGVFSGLAAFGVGYILQHLVFVKY